MILNDEIGKQNPLQRFADKRYASQKQLQEVADMGRTSVKSGTDPELAEQQMQDLIVGDNKPLQKGTLARAVYGHEGCYKQRRLYG